MKGKYCRHRGHRAKPRLLREDLRHDHAGLCWLTASSGTNQVQSRWLVSAHGELRLAQQQLKLLTHHSTVHPCVTHDQIRKKLCVRVEFT